MHGLTPFAPVTNTTPRDMQKYACDVLNLAVL